MTVGLMNDNWRIKKLGEILKLEYGKPLPKSERISDGKFPVYGANGIKSWSDTYYYDNGSIIVGRKGSAGELTLTKGKFWPLDVTYYVTFDKKKYDLQFIYRLLQTLNLQGLAKGVKPGINRNDVYAISVNIPDSLNEQKRIVKKLDEAFEKIEKAKNNTEKNLQNARELFESYINSIFNNPGEDWETCPLVKHVRFIDYRGKTPQKTESGMRLITAKNVKNGFLQEFPQEFVDPDIYDNWMTRGIPKKGDILFTSEAPLANIAQLDTDKKVIFAQRIIILQPDQNKIDQTFLKYLLLSKPVKDRIFTKATGATVQGIKASLLKQIEIYFPEDLAQQKSIVKKLDALSGQTKKLEETYKKKLENLGELKKSILHKAFTGEL
ncbi:MAG: EcoKI restriction-modification system protein HsdS [bacterium ADurb.Bin212]|nr:MAG: EcoKI restriction-modification system protein HsdS [bacterium ADurb.Bin212]